MSDKSFQILPPKFFSTYSALKYINLSHSKLYKIADFTLGIPFLLEVDLSGNELIALTANVFTGAENLRTIDLSHNKISILSPEVFMNLKSLTEINLSHNELHNNTFNRAGVDWTDNIESLKILDLSHNQIFYYHMMPFLAFAGLPNLESLNLRFNQITIDYGVFASNHKLKTLDFSYNNMTYFELDYLMSVPSLENIYLHGNGITYPAQIEVSGVRAAFPLIKALGISDNTFSCEVLSRIIKKMVGEKIQLVIEEGKFVNDRRNLRGVSCH